MKKCAFAAARWTAERKRLALESLELHALQNSYRTAVITLPHIFGAQHNALLNGKTLTARM